jgi:hypothetical protein
MTRRIDLHSLHAVGIALSLATGCMLSPTDDGHVSSTTAPLTFSGLDIEPDAVVQVRAWDNVAHAMADVGAPVRSETTAIGIATDQPLYAWTAPRTLEPRFWRAGLAGGSCANVAANTTLATGSTYSVITVESNWLSCYNAHPTVGDFFNHCRSNHAPTAQIFTDDWSPVLVSPAALNLAGIIASAQIHLTFDNYQPVGYAFCNASNPAGCPPGLSGDPETYKYYQPDASSITQPSGSLSFAITPSRSDPMTIYIDDMRSSHLDFRVDGTKLVLGITFEPAGVEIPMDCIRNLGCAWAPREIDFTAPRAELAFELAMVNGHVAFSSVSTTFATGVTGSDLANQAATAIATALHDMVTSNPDIHSAVNSALDQVVRGVANLGDFPLDGVTVSGGVLRVKAGCPMT